MSELNPRRTIDELKELRALTGDETWRAARRLHAEMGKGAKLAGKQSKGSRRGSRSAMKPATFG